MTQNEEGSDPLTRVRQAPDAVNLSVHLYHKEKKQTVNMIKTAIVSGACSGTGLALTRHLLLQQDVTSSSGPALQEWRVVLADINQEAYERIKDTLEPAAANGKESRHMFVRTDVSSWEDLANLFLTAFDWPGPGQGRIEFVASNAGIDDHALKVGLLDDDQEGADSGAPQKPDLRVLQVDLHSVLFATKLLVHYTRKTRRNLASADQEPSVATTIFEPKIVVTASMASQYPFFLIPQYTAAKHGCLGLVRALAPALLKDEGITINCIMPGTVDTGLIPDAVLAQWPAEHLTPLDTILRAFMELLGDWDRVAAIDGDVDSDAPDRGVKSGCAVECSGRQLWYRGPVDFKDDTMQWVAAQSMPDGILGRFSRDMKSKLKAGRIAQRHK